MAKRAKADRLFKKLMRQLRYIRPADIIKYQKYYDEQKLQSKVTSVVDIVGENVLLPVLRAYYILGSKSVPIEQKLLLAGALGYFVVPTDVIPDFLGAFGLIDDLAVVTFVLKQVKDNTSKEIDQKAIRKYTQLLHRTPHPIA